ncbi:hypothetical protein DV738_g4681, partial [Chaetothyriales sp. CBS 135597]
MTDQPLHQRKKLLRKAVAGRLGKLSPAEIAEQSTAITERALALKQYQTASRISIFLSMPGKEASTTDIVLHALRHGKTVFIPYIHAGSEKGSKTMDMLRIESENDLNSLKPDAWGIPSLSPDSISHRENALGGHGIEGVKEHSGLQGPKLDLIFMPAVAFDSDHNRLGHGRGFYDRYLQKYHDLSGHSLMPLTVGLCLREQLLSDGETIPHNDRDWTVDLVVTPDS